MDIIEQKPLTNRMICLGDFDKFLEILSRYNVNIITDKYKIKKNVMALLIAIIFIIVCFMLSVLLG